MVQDENQNAKVVLLHFFLENLALNTKNITRTKMVLCSHILLRFILHLKKYEQK